MNNFLKVKLSLKEAWKELMHIPRRHLLYKNLDLTACQKEPGIVEILTRNIWVGNIERIKHIKFDSVSLLLTCGLGIPGDQCTTSSRSMEGN